MRKKWKGITILLPVVLIAALTACGGTSEKAVEKGQEENLTVSSEQEQPEPEEPGTATPTAAGAKNQEEAETGNETEITEVKIKITVGNTELTAVMEDNATTQALIEQMPMTLPMMDLYGREMCYRYGADALPTDHLQSDGYEVGDLAYWVPGGSLVILYKQNGEQFERQHLGHIDSGVEIFEDTGDVDVTFELMEPIQ